jgi:hypothetical protein
VKKKKRKLCWMPPCPGQFHFFLKKKKRKRKRKGEREKKKVSRKDLDNKSHEKWRSEIIIILIK